MTAHLRGRDGRRPDRRRAAADANQLAAETRASAALDVIEEAFLVRGSPVQVELAQLADPDLSGGFQTVMPPGIEVRQSGADELRAWLDVVAEPNCARHSAHVHRDP